MNSAFAIDVRGVTKKFGARAVVNDIAMQVFIAETRRRDARATTNSEPLRRISRHP